MYEGGVPIGKWKLRQGGDGVDIEQTTIKGFHPYAAGHNMLLVIEMLANPIWHQEVRRLVKLFDNDRADEELEGQPPEEDELPF
jgi:hypothetical protein